MATVAINYILLQANHHSPYYTLQHKVYETSVLLLEAIGRQPARTLTDFLTTVSAAFYKTHS